MQGRKQDKERPRSTGRVSLTADCSALHHSISGAPGLNTGLAVPTDASVDTRLAAPALNALCPSTTMHTKALAPTLPALTLPPSMRTDARAPTLTTLDLSPTMYTQELPVCVSLRSCPPMGRGDLHQNPPLTITRSAARHLRKGWGKAFAGGP
uniref:Uncharacterized protein n=1 Tax=Chromera velia CCMP2878 TaxID=1169474 RepID=A0A0G4H0H6_9ALVE|eukprot:Cvel_24201.t1-p1 / transcript=Cvel_24201.t1 / gene=Cvel_24201 / organism=Chromera_velia_CCMP2878 / gene_product=hypothetical protein / transcript_product=hypothetical protein / location=Cvel_scaffold2585:19556-20011(-) / protein_length=152 / sequence_SO=supercontig / SO=protein_coding / is_pseudo=false